MDILNRFLDQLEFHLAEGGSAYVLCPSLGYLKVPSRLDVEVLDICSLSLQQLAVLRIRKIIEHGRYPFRGVPIPKQLGFRA